MKRLLLPTTKKKNTKYTYNSKRKRKTIQIQSIPILNLHAKQIENIRCEKRLFIWTHRKRMCHIQICIHQLCICICFPQSVDVLYWYIFQVKSVCESNWMKWMRKILFFLFFFSLNLWYNHMQRHIRHSFGTSRE